MKLLRVIGCQTFNIQNAISSKNQIFITYNSLYKSEQTKRNIEPQAIYFTNNVWVVIAFCHLRNELREFRLDRIIHLNWTSLQFEKLEYFKIQEYFESFQT
ncbi:helix-turn-helix transcriptional regulator [uncultured Tenacibaculum sp.]|uniref:helix-turn-helix transcriptional regulator n=1 Tax=uncultured Tenacibaculum sp. TaxID=174713 RepID=UPI003592FB82